MFPCLAHWWRCVPSNWRRLGSGARREQGGAAQNKTKETRGKKKRPGASRARYIKRAAAGLDRIYASDSNSLHRRHGGTTALRRGGRGRRGRVLRRAALPPAPRRARRARLGFGRAQGVCVRFRLVGLCACVRAREAAAAPPLRRRRRALASAPVVAASQPLPCFSRAASSRARVRAPSTTTGRAQHRARDQKPRGVSRCARVLCVGCGGQHPLSLARVPRPPLSRPRKPPHQQKTTHQPQKKT